MATFKRIKRIRPAQVKLDGGQSLPTSTLLMMIMLATTSTIHSESSFLQQTSPLSGPSSPLRDPNFNQQFSSKHPVADVSEQPTNVGQFSKTSAATSLEQQQQQFASIYSPNNANNHFVLVGEVNEQQGPQRIATQSGQFSPLVNQDNTSTKRIQSNLALKPTSNNNNPEESTILATESHLINPTEHHQTQAQDKTNASPTSFESGERSIGQQVSDGSLLEDQKPSEGLQDDTTHSVQGATGGNEPMLERRFGLFKKGQASNNNNLAGYYSNYGPLLPQPPPYSSDCERCLPGLGLSAAAAASAAQQQHQTVWLPEQQPPPLSLPYGQPLMPPSSSYAPMQQHHNLIIPSLGQHFGSSFKSKLNKFHFPKPMGLRDSYLGQNYYLNHHRYRSPMSSRMPYRSPAAAAATASFLSQQPFNCIHQSGLLTDGVGNGGATIVGPILSNQHAIGGGGEDPLKEVAQQMSYTN